MTTVFSNVINIYTRVGSHSSRYVKSFVRGFRCGITTARSSCSKLRMLSATMNRVPASKWDKRHGTTLHNNVELRSGREWLKTGRPKRVLGCYPHRQRRKYAVLTMGGTIKGSPVTRSIRCSEYTRLPNRRPPGQADPPLRPRTKVGQGKFKAWRRRLSRLDAGRARPFGRIGGDFSEPAPFWLAFLHL